MKNIIYNLLSLILIFIVLACSKQKPERIILNIIQTSDIHGSILPVDFTNNKPVNNSLANVYSLVKQTRNENGEGTILLDNGDYLHAQPSVYYYNYIDTVSTHLAADVFNYMGYDAVTLGNHDIETGHAVYDRFRKQLKASYLAANAIANSGEPYFKPYAIIERQGLRIAVLGLTTPGVLKRLPSKLYDGMHFADMVETAQKWVQIIHEKEAPDLIIGMFHSGVTHTYEYVDSSTYMSENASLLIAKKVPGFDIVLAGHDHIITNKKILNNNGDTVLLMNPGCYSRAVSFIEVEFVFDKKSGQYKKLINAEVKPVSDFKPDEDFLNAFKKPYKAIEDYLNQNVGALKTNINSKWGYFGNSAVTDLLHTVQMRNTEAEISFAAPLHFKFELKKGLIYINDLFKLYKNQNLITTVTLTGNEIDSYLEYASSKWFNTMNNKHDHLLNITSNDDGKIFLQNSYDNFSSAAGIDYIVDVSKKDGQKVKILGFSNGEYFYADSTYKVALNSYRGVGGGGHLTMGVGLSEQEIEQRFVCASDKDIRRLIIEYIKESNTIEPKAKSNWRIIPEDFYEVGKNKDLELLFGNN